MDLTLGLTPGPPVRFGAIQLTGLSTVKEDAVRRRLPWQPGELITAERLDAGRSALLESEPVQLGRLRPRRRRPMPRGGCR